MKGISVPIMPLSGSAKGSDADAQNDASNDKVQGFEAVLSALTAPSSPARPVKALAQGVGGEAMPSAWTNAQAASVAQAADVQSVVSLNNVSAGAKEPALQTQAGAAVKEAPTAAFMGNLTAEAPEAPEAPEADSAVPVLPSAASPIVMSASPLAQPAQAAQSAALPLAPKEAPAPSAALEADAAQSALAGAAGRLPAGAAKGRSAVTQESATGRVQVSKAPTQESPAQAVEVAGSNEKSPLAGLLGASAREARDEHASLDRDDAPDQSAASEGKLPASVAAQSASLVQQPQAAAVQRPSAIKLERAVAAKPAAKAVTPAPTLPSATSLEASTQRADGSAPTFQDLLSSQDPQRPQTLNANARSEVDTNLAQTPELQAAPTTGATAVSDTSDSATPALSAAGEAPKAVVDLSGQQEAQGAARAALSVEVSGPAAPDASAHAAAPRVPFVTEDASTGAKLTRVEFFSAQGAEALEGASEPNVEPAEPTRDAADAKPAREVSSEASGQESFGDAQQGSSNDPSSAEQKPVPAAAPPPFQATETHGMRGLEAVVASLLRTGATPTDTTAPSARASARVLTAAKVDTSKTETSQSAERAAQASLLEQRELAAEREDDHKERALDVTAPKAAHPLWLEPRAPDLSPAPTPSATPAPAPTPQPLPDADAAMMGKLARGEGLHAAAISIEHPELGSMDVTVRNENGRIDVRAVMDTPRAAAVMRAHESALRYGIQQAGMTFGALRVRARNGDTREVKTRDTQKRRRNHEWEA